MSDADAERGTATVVLTNCLGFSQKLESGEEIGTVLPGDLVDSEKTSQGVVSQVPTDDPNAQSLVEESVEQRKEKLHEALKPELSGTRGEQQLSALLEEYHEVFSLGKDDRGEMELHIDTGDTAPRKYPV